MLQKESQNKVNISGLLIKFDVKDQGSLAIKAQAKNLKLATMNWINLKSKAKELIID